MTKTNLPRVPLYLQADNFTFQMWGGDWIPRLKSLKVPASPVGESWEFSAYPKMVSRVSTPAGFTHNLKDLIEWHPHEILGEKVAARFGSQAPLLIKFIDARDDLSLQVHPSDSVAGVGSQAKTECWLILDVDKSNGGGFIYLGFNPDKYSSFVSREDFQEAFLGALLQANAQGPSLEASIREKSTRLVLPFVNKIPVSPGELYYVPAGAIHAIGRGIRVLEVQESSDTTYRIWDWNRPDAEKLKQGQTQFRELHLDQAKKSLNFTPQAPEFYRVVRRKAGCAQEEILISEADKKFAAHVLNLSTGQEYSGETKNTFHVLTATEGEADIYFAIETSSPFEKFGRLSQGHSILIPASVPYYKTVGLSSKTKVIKTFVPL